MNQLRNLSQQNWHPHYTGSVSQYLNDLLSYNNEMLYLDPYYEMHEYVADAERIARLKDMFELHPKYDVVQNLCDLAPVRRDSLDALIQRLKKALDPKNLTRLVVHIKLLLLMVTPLLQ